jgi:hypothetical protein
MKCELFKWFFSFFYRNFKNKNSRNDLFWAFSIANSQQENKVKSKSADSTTGS